MPMTAKMKMMMHRTKVRLERAPIVFAMIVRISLRDFQDLANLNTRRSLKGKIIIKIGAKIDPPPVMAVFSRKNLQK